jgi:hypothetical protein
MKYIDEINSEGFTIINNVYSKDELEKIEIMKKENKKITSFAQHLEVVCRKSGTETQSFY